MLIIDLEVSKTNHIFRKQFLEKGIRQHGYRNKEKENGSLMCTFSDNFQELFGLVTQEIMTFCKNWMENLVYREVLLQEKTKFI